MLFLTLLVLADDSPGWSKDGRYFRYGGYETHVIDAVTGVEIKTPVEIVPGQAKRKHPDGKREAVITEQAPKKIGEACSNASVRTHMFVEQGTTQTLSAAAGPAGTIAPYWSPDGLRVAWVIQDPPMKSCRMACPEPDSTALIGPAVGPRLHVLGDAGKDKAILATIIPALHKGGFAPTLVGVAQTHRAASVVYARKAVQAEAKALAAIVPGGATVDVLNWGAPAEIVLALGDSAFGGAK
jgi:hypothetical protein